MTAFDFHKLSAMGTPAIPATPIPVFPCRNTLVVEEEASSPGLAEGSPLPENLVREPEVWESSRDAMHHKAADKQRSCFALRNIRNRQAYNGNDNTG
jgi:hypothetical protein